jgi:hypothetical protein
MAVPLEGHVTAAEAAFTLPRLGEHAWLHGETWLRAGLGAVRTGTFLSAAGADGAAQGSGHRHIRRQMKRRTSPVASPAVWCHLIRRMLDRQ